MDEKKQSEDIKIEFSVNPDTTPVLYTDNIQMSTNEDGVVFDIGQRLGTTNQVRIVSRIGMSREHAKKFLRALNELLDQSGGQVQTGKAVRA